MTIREKRKKDGLRLIDIAQKTGIDAATLSNIENNRYIPSTAQKRKIATAMGCSIDSLRFPKAILAYGG